MPWQCLADAVTLKCLQTDFDTRLSVKGHALVLGMTHTLKAKPPWISGKQQRGQRRCLACIRKPGNEASSTFQRHECSSNKF
jgi:hypothetical protein